MSADQEHERKQAKDFVVQLISRDVGIPAEKVAAALDKIESTGSARERESLTSLLNVTRKALSRSAAAGAPSLVVLHYTLRLLRFVDRIKKMCSFSRADGPRLPGSTMLCIASVFFSKKRMERTFEPIVADYRTEFFEALEESWLKAQFVRLRYWWAFTNACGLHAGFKLAVEIIAKISGP